MSETLRDIRIFVAAYEERSFTAAASREQATQSGVSQHIRKLEDRFALKLFLRQGGRIEPTPAGDYYYRQCLSVLRAQDEAAQGVKRFASGLEGEIAVGLMPTMTRCALAPALSGFLAAHPNVRVRLIEAYSAVLTQMVRAGELQFAIVPAFPVTTGLACRSFALTPEVLVRRAGAAPGHLVPVRVAELPPLDLVLPGPSNTRRGTLESYVISHGGAARADARDRHDARHARADRRERVGGNPARGDDGERVPDGRFLRQSAGRAAAFPRAGGDSVGRAGARAGGFFVAGGTRGGDGAGEPALDDAARDRERRARGCYSAAERSPIARLTAGRTFSAISTIERRASAGSAQSWPA